MAINNFKEGVLLTAESALVMVKPDGVPQTRGEVITRLRKGLQPVAIKMMQMEPELAARHYGHRGKPFMREPDLLLHRGRL